MAQADKDDRTEAPSAKRLARAREEGRVAVSRELQTLSGLGVAILALVMLVPSRADRFVIRMRGLMENAATIDVSGGGAFTVLHELFGFCITLAGPVLLAGAAGTIAMTMVQTGFLLRFEALMPKPGRLSPMKGLSRIFGGETAVDSWAIFDSFPSHVEQGGRLVSLPAWHRTGLRELCYELFAQHVIPHFTGQLAGPVASHDWITGSGTHFVDQAAHAIGKAIDDHAAERAVT